MAAEPSRNDPRIIQDEEIAAIQKTRKIRKLEMMERVGSTIKMQEPRCISLWQRELRNE
ncbi:MAG: hypothetical protein JWM04_2300 [Verrucomicrobiales bacterium]|nr:hypothetical protein [Verrucomicrobiales bacterium]